MENLYHVCLTAHKEVLLRNEEDAMKLINASALSARNTGATLLTDAEMSTHLHDTLICQRPLMFSYSLEDSFTKDFNRRHNRKGKLFDPRPFILKLDGPNHIQMALCYALRQGMHHGITSTPYEYPWCSCNSLFTKERGLRPCRAAFSGVDLKEFFPKNAKLPEEWATDENGILLRSTFENLTLVENWFGTARSFATSMNRRTTQEWLDEQNKDANNCENVTIDLIEKGFSSADITEMLKNEGNPKYVRRAPTDMEICKLIDRQMLGRYHAKSVYELNVQQKLRLIDELRHDCNYTNLAQLSRCVALQYSCN